MGTNRARVTVKVEGAELTFIERRKPVWGYRMSQRDWTREWREYNEGTRLYVSVADETLLENLQNRCRRPYNVYKRMIAASGIGAVLDLTGLRWSQNAGCTMCPCSPGFIIPRQAISIGLATFTNFDVWVKLDGAPSTDPLKAPRVLAGAL